MRKVLLILVAMLTTCVVNARNDSTKVNMGKAAIGQEPRKQRAKVAVVLSGGGAKGMAHRFCVNLGGGFLL